MIKSLSAVFTFICLLLPATAYSVETNSISIKDLADKQQANEDVINELTEEPGAGPYDEYNRSTPRSSLLGLAKAIRSKDFDLAVNYLDLRNLPFSDNQKNTKLTGPALAEKLSIVAKRAMSIDIQELSTLPLGHKEDGLPGYRDRITTLMTKDGPVDILMQRVPRGDGISIWKISNATVAIIPELNKEFGYGVIGETLSQIIPGYVIAGIELWQLILFTFLVLIGFVVSYLFTFLLINILQRNQKFNKSRLLKFIVGPLRLLIVVIFVRTTFDLIAPTIVMRAVSETKTILILAILWVLLGVVDFIIYRLADRMRNRGQKDSVVLLKPASTSLKLLLILIACITWIDNLGFEVTALLAGLGVGGIAIALAAQKSLEDLIGAIIIYVSHPVRVGDFCKFGNTIGTVEEIGLRATQLRTLARSVVHVPNSKFASGEIENLTQRDKILYRTRLRLSYETTSEQIKQVLGKLRELIDKHEYIDEKDSRVRFLEFGEYAQELELYVYIKTRDFSEYLAHREDVNLQVSGIVESAGTQLVIQAFDLQKDKEKS
ncbi:MAG: mechanosensitive ion channel family protein [endosymbiont of Galathealinum brachiosum]|uniref:Mechanosensitive ion channel family protein n=1 Tax=endosymbiont of Galathealinum brachiosum TaxID=2200906 RepID=A0A370DFZ5_9GAMM|nr:MAG: mechanosensitive ion channel family protein [endosymbiont of Galathealinum brachiosum]